MANKAKGHTVEIRLYRRHDLDLMSLTDHNICIVKMMRLALENYVAGERIKFRLPDARLSNITNSTETSNGTSMLRYRFKVYNPEVVQLLKSVKRGYQNQFCKDLLRDMLDADPFGAFFTTQAELDFENERLAADAVVMDGLGLIKKREQMDQQKVKARKAAGPEAQQEAEKKLLKDEGLKKRPVAKTAEEEVRDAEDHLFQNLKRKAPPKPLPERIEETEMKDDTESIFGSFGMSDEPSETNEKLQKDRERSLMDMFDNMF